MKRWYVICGAGICIVTALSVFEYVKNHPSVPVVSQQIIRVANDAGATSAGILPKDGSTCLNDDQVEGRENKYVDNKWQNTIYVKDKNTDKILWSRLFRDDEASTWFGVSVNRCHYYAVEKEPYGTSGYKYGIFRHSYFADDKGVLLEIATENATGKDEDFRDYYSYEFSTDPSDTYLFLTRGYMGRPDYAIVIRNMVTGKDVYTLTLADVMKTHPNDAGTFDVGHGIKGPDGMYLTTSIDDMERQNALVYVKLGTWETLIYDTPADYQHGTERDYAPFEPYMYYTDVPHWTGSSDGEQMLNQIAREEGKTVKHLIFANLKTGATTTIATVPLTIGQRFNPTWIDDSTLQYTMPDGKKKTYTVLK